MSRSTIAEDASGSAEAPPASEFREPPREAWYLSLIHIWVPLLQLNRLRNAEAHENFRAMHEALEVMSFDTALLNGGYGLALDHVFDACANAIAILNSELQNALSR